MTEGQNVPSWLPESTCYPEHDFSPRLLSQPREARLYQCLESDLGRRVLPVPPVQDKLGYRPQSQEPFDDRRASQVRGPQRPINDFTRCRNFNLVGLDGIRIRYE
ncbi:MAG TPA: hypothetical protein VKJ47_15850 [Candidatus Binatia bacterium]|nr:hypothetical protein [Candidatus Binatia bacterium]